MSEHSENLCRAIAEASGGVCLLGFSRGKDSIASWLYLRSFFERIVPFHVANVPHLSFVDASLQYYEQFFRTPIDRFMDGDAMMAVHELVYQPIEDRAEIDALGLWKYDKHDICNLIRREQNIPRAWCAYGINASDSLDRRIYVNQYQGRIDERRSFYPCFDWTRNQILDIIKDNDIKLPDDYLIANRSCAGIPGVRHLTRMEEVFPQDFNRVECMYPFIRAQLARNEFRKQHQSTNFQTTGFNQDSR